MNSHFQIHRATESEQELTFLSKIADNLNDHSSKLVYADWLDEQGDTERASFIRKTVAAIESGDAGAFPDLDAFPKSWVQATGAPLSKAILEQGEAAEHHDVILSHAIPCLNYESDKDYDWGADMTLDESIPVGATKVFGLPDLPSGTQWPKQKDCNSFYDPGSGIDPETYCSFVCQINFADFAGTQAARWMPERGLLSIFSCSEIESIGMVDGLVIFTPDIASLEPMVPPMSLIEGSEDEDEANVVRDAMKIEFTEGFDIPAAGSESPFPFFKREYGEGIYDELYTIRDEIGTGELDRIMGFTRPTSGDDPLPGAEYCKLICISNTIEMKLHFCIKRDDLKAGRFDNVELAWVDFD